MTGTARISNDRGVQLKSILWWLSSANDAVSSSSSFWKNDIAAFYLKCLTSQCLSRKPEKISWMSHAVTVCCQAVVPCFASGKICPYQTSTILQARNHRQLLCPPPAELAYAAIAASSVSAAASDCAASLNQPAKCAVSTTGREGETEHVYPCYVSWAPDFFECSRRPNTILKNIDQIYSNLIHVTYCKMSRIQTCSRSNSEKDCS